MHDQAAGFALLVASTSQQVAQEWQEQEHGVFTYFLIRGLTGKARQGQPFVTVSALSAYVPNELRKWNANRSLVQEPTALLEGIGDFILADFRTAPL